jgi:hypothetical protein
MHLRKLFPNQPPSAKKEQGKGIPSTNGKVQSTWPVGGATLKEHVATALAPSHNVRLNIQSYQ